MTEASVTEKKGTYLFCDTDSLAIVSSRDGGPLNIPGSEGLRALTWAEVSRIANRFSSLNPYDRKAVKGSILNLVDANFVDCDSTKPQRQLYGFSIAAKRYALYEKTGKSNIANVLEMLGEWGIARPYNFLLLPMVDPVSGVAFHRQSNEKVLLVCPFSSKQEEWFGLECINVHDGKQYKMLNCKKTNGDIPYNVIFPSQFAHLVVQYQRHAEAKSLAPDGTACKAETKGLLGRAM